MATSYRPAFEAERIGKDLIEQHYPDIAQSGVRIAFVFRNEAAKRGGQIVFGTCSKVTGRNAWLSQEGKPMEDYPEPKDLQYYVIELAEDVWKTLTPKQREALVDHELAHCLLEPDEDDGSWAVKLADHDISEFADVLKRHGLWKPDLEWFARQTSGVFQQSLLDR